MAPETQLKNLIQSAPVVVFKSPVTEMDALRRALKARDIVFEEIELSMGDSDSRALFQELKQKTRYTFLPQVFVEGTFIGGGDAAIHSNALASPHKKTNLAAKKLIQLLGYAGVLPFVLFTLLAYVTELRDWAINANIAYGAVILTFIGAIDWGKKIEKPLTTFSMADGWSFIVSVLPSLVAWFALAAIISPVFSLALLIVGFISMLIYEKRQHRDAADWYQTMRAHLTYLVSALLGLTLLASLISS